MNNTYNEFILSVALSKKDLEKHIIFLYLNDKSRTKSPEILEIIYKKHINDFYIMDNILQLPEVTTSMVMDISSASDNWDVRIACINYCKELPVERLKVLRDFWHNYHAANYVQIDRAIAKHPNATSELLDKIYWEHWDKHTDMEIHSLVIQHPNCPESILKEYSENGYLFEGCPTRIVMYKHEGQYIVHQEFLIGTSPSEK